MITLRNVTNEIGYSIMCYIESNICKLNMLLSLLVIRLLKKCFTITYNPMSTIVS